MKRYKLTLGYLFILFVFTFSCRPEGEVVRANIQNFLPEDQAKIGNTLSWHITKNPTTYNIYRPERNQELYMYLNTVLSTIVNTMTVVNRDVYSWEIFVLRDDEVESAFTLPGGKIYITSGFLRFLENEGQLISLLSHEMCYADHSLAMNKLQEEFSGLVLGDIVFNNPISEEDLMIDWLQSQAYSELKVKQADLYSIDLLCPFEYDPSSIAKVLMNVTDENFPLEWQITRPRYEGRIDTIMTRSIACIEEDDNTDEDNRYVEKVLNLLD